MPIQQQPKPAQRMTRSQQEKESKKREADLKTRQILACLEDLDKAEDKVTGRIPRHKRKMIVDAYIQVNP